jgi:uncharacterized FAD-dependent dehydrogenase
VRERTQDTWGLWRKKVLDPESNVQFGEGGAGTFSDGKLYSQIKDPKHYGRKVLEEFVKAGAPAEILYVSKPHIGTFRLVGMVEQMRHEIERSAARFRFQQRVTELQIEAGQVRGVTLASGEELRAEHVILALGHSARDTFAMLHAPASSWRPNPFRSAFRIEHPQSLIDRASRDRTPATRCSVPPTTSWCITAATGARCTASACARRHGGGRHFRAGPGGDQRHEPVFAQRAQRQRRHRRRHHAARLPRRAAGRHRAAARLEARAFELGGGTYEAPAQLVGDFLAGRPSTGSARWSLRTSPACA